MTRRKDPRTARLPVPAGELPAFTPVPRQCNRHDGWTPDRQRRFIEALADTGSVEAACRAVDMSSVGAYHLRRQPGADEFRAAWEAALQLGVQRIEDVAMDRALNGVEEPVYSYGKLVGTRIKRNDGLLMFLLRNRAPERFAAGGGAKRMNALDKQELARLKKKWRKEWEAEQGRVTSADVRASIERKIIDIRRRLERERPERRAVLSPETLAAFAHSAPCATATSPHRAPTRGPCGWWRWTSTSTRHTSTRPQPQRCPHRGAKRRRSQASTRRRGGEGAQRGRLRSKRQAASRCAAGASPAPADGSARSASEG